MSLSLSRDWVLIACVFKLLSLNPSHEGRSPIWMKQALARISHRTHWGGHCKIVNHVGDHNFSPLIFIIDEQIVSIKLFFPKGVYVAFDGDHCVNHSEKSAPFFGALPFGVGISII